MGTIYHLQDEIGRYRLVLPRSGRLVDLGVMVRCCWRDAVLVSRVPEDRFSLHRFGHPRRQERVKAYTCGRRHRR